MTAAANLSARNNEGQPVAVNVGNALQPSKGQVLTATDSTDATWQIPGSGGSATGAFATGSTPAMTSATAVQVNTANDVMLYANIGTAAIFSLAMGPTTAATTTIVNSATAVTNALYSVRVPSAWYVNSTFTGADLTWTAVTC